MGYTNKDYINTFTKYHECVDLNPESDDEQLDISPLLPFILADTGYNYYMKFVRPLKLKFELKRCRKQMIQAYTEFNRDLFDAFDDYDKKHNTGDGYESMTASFIDKMDVFLETLTDHLRVVRVQVMQALPAGTPFDVKQVVAATLMFNHLAKCAQDLWKMTFDDGTGGDAEHPALNNLMHKTQLFATLYMKQHGQLYADIDSDKAKPIQQAANILYRYIIKWVVDDMKEN